MTGAAARRYGTLIGVIATVLFILSRLMLIFARQPFFDELFTVWLARQPVSSIVPALLHDSGPPLYYFLARFDSVMALRTLSLVFAAIQFVLVMRWSPVAAALLAVYPPAALFATDARAYALCGLFVTAGVLSLDRRRPYLAAACFVLAAYSHYYGVLFFPLLIAGGIPRYLFRAGGQPSRRTTRDQGADDDERPEASEGQRVTSLRDHLAAFIVALILFAPGVFLALHQPSAATRWFREPLYAPLINISFAGAYPESLFARPPIVAIAFALILLVVLVSKSARFAPAVVIPIVLAIAFHLAGRPVYFPMRFESVLAGPLVLWLTSSVFAWKPVPGLPLAAMLASVGMFVIGTGGRDHLVRPIDPYREAAVVLSRHTRPGDTVVATGYLYLEAAAASPGPILAMPADQAEHPGWRSTSRPEVETLPTKSFLWIGERSAPELLALRGVRTLQPLFMNERAMIARASKP